MILEYDDDSNLLYAHEDTKLKDARVKEKIGRVNQWDYELDDPGFWTESELQEIDNFMYYIRRLKWKMS